MKTHSTPARRAMRVFWTSVSLFDLFMTVCCLR